MENVTFYTHDGIAHADDAFAVAILRIIYPKAEVVRTRDLAVIQEAAGSPGAFLLDIGGVYNPDTRQFDHHQPEGAGYRDEELRRWPYATAGLVWKHYGEQAIRKLHPELEDEEVHEVLEYIDQSVLRYIDAVDCGVRLKSAGPSLSALIASFNRPWFEPESDPFPLVTALCHELLSNFVKRHVGKVVARSRVRKGRRELDGRVLVLDKCLPWTEVVAAEMPEVLIVVYPVGNEWSPQWQIRTASDEMNQPRMYLPQSWAGYERGSLASVCGEETALFCHRSRHLAGATSYEGAVRMAQTALQHHFEAEVVLS